MRKQIALVFIILTLLLTSCLIGTSGLDRDLLSEPESISGTYDLILIGGAYAYDPDRVAILDIPGDGYEFKPVTEEYRVKRIPGLSARESLERAQGFFSEHCAYNGFDTKKLTLPGSEQVGYELIPDYPTVLCEYGNEIIVSYGKENNGVIKVYTRLMLREDDNGRPRGMRVRP